MIFTNILFKISHFDSFAVESHSHWSYLGSIPRGRNIFTLKKQKEWSNRDKSSLIVSVARFGEISPLWCKVKIFSHFDTVHFVFT